MTGMSFFKLAFQSEQRRALILSKTKKKMSLLNTNATEYGQVLIKSSWIYYLRNSMIKNEHLQKLIPIKYFAQF